MDTDEVIFDSEGLLLLLIHFLSIYLFISWFVYFEICLFICSSMYSFLNYLFVSVSIYIFIFTITKIVVVLQSRRWLHHCPCLRIYAWSPKVDAQILPQSWQGTAVLWSSNEYNLEWIDNRCSFCWKPQGFWMKKKSIRILPSFLDSLMFGMF